MRKLEPLTLNILLTSGPRILCTSRCAGLIHPSVLRLFSKAVTSFACLCHLLTTHAACVCYMFPRYFGLSCRRVSSAPLGMHFLSTRHPRTRPQGTAQDQGANPRHNIFYLTIQGFQIPASDPPKPVRIKGNRVFYKSNCVFYNASIGGCLAHHGKKAWPQACEMANHTALMVRRQRRMWALSFHPTSPPFFFSLDPSPWNSCVQGRSSHLR